MRAWRQRYGQERLRRVWEYLRTTFWFVPALMGVGAVGLLAAADQWDARLTGAPERDVPWFVYVSAPDDAREVLSTLLSSMITMATLVFSITMVVLSLAANQFGPRLIRSFMASPQTQLVLGTFVMTIVYCMLVLSSIGARGEAGPFPFSTVTIAIALALLSIAVLVFFLHTLARSIVSETVIERVGRELDRVIERLEPLEPGPSSNGADVLPDDLETKSAFFGPSKAGHVQAIRLDRLIDLAEGADVTVALYFRPGDYVAEGGRGIAVYPGDRLDPALASAVQNCILVGAHRTPIQDPEFLIRHLVEIAVRALSPGVNDPYTAVAVTGRLSASVARLMSRGLATGVLRDGGGRLRVAYPVPTYRSLLGTAFDQIRQNGADKPLVAIHLLEAIGRVAEHARLPAQLEALGEQLSLVGEAAKRAIDDPSDRADVARRAEAAERALSRAKAREAASRS